MMTEDEEIESPTNAWFVVSVMLGVFGGIIGYFAVRNIDQKMANQLLKVGVYVTIVAPLYYLLFTPFPKSLEFIPPSSAGVWSLALLFAFFLVSMGYVICKD